MDISKKGRLFVAIVAELKVFFFVKAEDRVFKNEGTFFYKLKQKF